MHADKAKKYSSSGLGYALAAAAGALLGIVFAPKSGAETRDDIADKAKQLAQRFGKTRVEVQAAVEDIFGEVSDELEKNYLEVKSALVAAVDELENKSELTKRKFDSLVEDIISDYSDGRDWTSKIKNNLSKNLKEGWQELKEKYEMAKEDVKENV